MCSTGSDEQPTPPAATPQTSEEGQEQPMEAAPGTPPPPPLSLSLLSLFLSPSLSLSLIGVV